MPGTITTRPPESGRYRRGGRTPGQARAEPPAIPENDAATTSLVSPGRPSVAPIHKKTRATGVDGTSQRLASSGNCGPRPRLKVRASPGAEAGDLRRRSDRDTRPRPPPGGLGGPRRPETRSRIPEQAAAGRARSPDAETDKAGTVAIGRRRRRRRIQSAEEASIAERRAAGVSGRPTRNRPTLGPRRRLKPRQCVASRLETH